MRLRVPFWCLAVAVLRGVEAHAVPEDMPGPRALSMSSVALAGADLARGQSGGVTIEGPNRFTNIRFEVHGAFGWYGAAGIGGRIEFPLLRHGLLQKIDDELALSLGAEVFYFYGPDLGVGATPLAALQWNFFVSPSVSLFPELGVAFIFGPERARYWAAFVGPYLGFGIRFHFTDRNAVLLRGSWPAGLQLGLTF